MLAAKTQTNDLRSFLQSLVESNLVPVLGDVSRKPVVNVVTETKPIETKLEPVPFIKKDRYKKIAGMPEWMIEDRRLLCIDRLYPHACVDCGTTQGVYIFKGWFFHPTKKLVGNLRPRYWLRKDYFCMVCADKAAEGEWKQC